MSKSLLALTALPEQGRLNVSKLLEALRSAQFVQPKAIINSSVGDFYMQHMSSFTQLAKDVYDYVYATTPSRVGGDILSIEPILVLAYQCMPLGCLASAASVSQVFDECPTNYDYAPLHTHYLPEVQDAVAHISIDNKVYVDNYSASTKELAKIAQSICVGYTPNTSVPMTSYVRADSGCLYENTLAATIYPWVMQPIKQLRMLIPALDPAVTAHIKKASLQPDVQLASTQFGNAPCFDVVTDYLTYMSFLDQTRRVPNFRIQRQIWTPFFGIANSLEFSKHVSTELHQRILNAFMNSRKLYLEMLKTGLHYEAQYAVLCGMAGRFMFEAPIGSLAALTYRYEQDSFVATNPGRAIVSDIHDMLYVHDLAVMYGLVEDTNK